MQKKIFEHFYNSNIETIAKMLVKKNTRFKYNRNLYGLYEEYLNQKTFLKDLVKGSRQRNGSILDGHKVSACLTCAIIKIRLITSEEIDDDIDNSPYDIEKSNRLNEQLAVLCGLTCLLEYMKSDEENLYFDSKNKSKTTLIFPKTKYYNQTMYLDSLVRALYYSNLLSNINPLLLSHIYFLIEQYHRKCIELKSVINAT